MKNFSLLFLLLLYVFTSCKKKKTEEVIVCEPNDKLEVHLIPKINAENYSLDQVIISPMGYRYFFSEIKILGTDIKNESTFLSESYYFNFRENGTVLRMENGLKANFSNLNLNIGVPSNLNHDDPAIPSATSALNISNSGDMHWGWNPGYIFVKLEGKVDTLDNGIDNFDHNFVFHLGMDPLFRSINFTGINWLSIGTSHYKTNLVLQVNNLFDAQGDEVDLRNNFTSHSTNSQLFLSNLMMDKLVNAISKE